MLTHTNLARLAAWAGITPETHPDIFMEPFIYHDVSSFASIEWCPLDAPNLPNPTDPGEDPREVDRVWLADVWHTLGKEWEFRTGPTHADNPNEACCARMKSSNLMDYAPSATLALLRAARAAGVPEVIAAMGDGT
jgi:hypothetical protein